MNLNGTDKEVHELLNKAETIAVVGLSGKPERDSYKVSRFMQDHSYRIIPVNPKVNEVLGEKSYPDLTAIPHRVDIVNIFRRSEFVVPVVEEALKISPMAIWMQLGIANKEAAEICKKNGIQLITNKCIMVEYRRLKG